MEAAKERIMLVENDPQVSSLIAVQTLRPLGYQVNVMETAAEALKEIGNLDPELIITNLSLPGISGKDLLVALMSQGIHAPIIILTPKGHEHDALQAFRLGAMNFLTYPLREAEVVNVVEDTLSQFHKRHELEITAERLDQGKKQMEQYINDLVEIFSIGKLVPSAANQAALYEKVAHVAHQVTQADAALMLVLDIQKNKMILKACQNVDESIRAKLNLPFEDNLSSLVMVSGQIISMHGEALGSFNLPKYIQAYLAIPIKVKDSVVGMLSVVRNTPTPFTSEQQSLLEVIADYASALIENTHRYQLLEQRLFYQQQANTYNIIDADLKRDLLQQASLELHTPLKILVENVDKLLNHADRRLGLKLNDAVNIIDEQASDLLDIADSMARVYQGETSRSLEEVDLNQLARDALNRFQPITQACQLTIKLDIPVLPCNVTVFPSQLTQVLDGIISNALKYSPAKSLVNLKIEKKDTAVVFSVSNQGEGISPVLVQQIFDRKPGLFGEEAMRFGGIGISLPMVKEIIIAHKGEVWVDSGYGKGFTISFSLPL